MKVTFTCDECGHEVFVSSWARARDGDMLMQLPSSTDCPNCAKLTYGPLTEKMVAEALCEAKTNSNTGESGVDWAHWCELSEDAEVRDSFRHEARFVLRLLSAFGDKRKIRDDGTGFASLPWDFRKSDPGTTWRDWLLDLARQK